MTSTKQREWVEFSFSNKKCPGSPFHLGHRHAARLSGYLSSGLCSHGTQVLSPPLPTQTITPRACSCHEGTRGRGGTLRDGAADVMRLFEMVGAVSLRWDGTAHETWEGAGDSIITWVPDPVLGSDRPQGLQLALPAVSPLSQSQQSP